MDDPAKTGVKGRGVYTESADQVGWQQVSSEFSSATDTHTLTGKEHTRNTRKCENLNKPPVSLLMSMYICSVLESTDIKGLL